MRPFLYSGLFVLAALLLLAPPVRAADLPCDGVHFVWHIGNSGGFSTDITTTSDRCYDIQYAWTGMANQTWTAGRYNPASCSSDPVATGTSIFVSDTVTFATTTFTATKVCSPSPAILASTSVEALQMLLAMGGVALWAVGFMTGVQR